ncbi:hypothetical protein OG976_20270 [Mycobacterium sp. NBC_00419]|uniref:hypothetical protein n=1 Tax=Mycobacterium sp. NBC_00419 TaxID=2975989 RepID=UPI002E1EA3D0
MARIRNERLLVDELNMQLQYENLISSTGAAMTLPAAAEDLTGWITDQRNFISKQYDDWQQVMEDFNASTKATGPKLTRLVEPITDQIESLLSRMITPTSPTVMPSPIARLMRKWLPGNISDGIAGFVDPYLRRLTPEQTPAKTESHYTVVADVREAVRLLLEQLTVQLRSDAAILSAWRDLWSSADNINCAVDVVAFRRDTLLSIGQLRNLDVLGPFGVFRDLQALVGNSDNAVQEELSRERGVEHHPTYSGAQSNEPLWRRLELCENALIRPPQSGDCVVWLRLEQASLPQIEVAHGRVAFYNADFLTSAIGRADLADRFTVPPVELLNLPSAQAESMRRGDDAWGSSQHITYARVHLPSIEVHEAEATARAVIEALKAVNPPEKNTWQLLNGAILFVDGCLPPILSWELLGDIPDMYYPDTDHFGYDLEQMSPNGWIIDAESLHDIQGVIAMSTTLRLAADESPQAVVMASVRVIEHMNTWTTGGKLDWGEFVSRYFKKAESRRRVVHFINHFSLLAIKWCVNELNVDEATKRRIAQIRSEIEHFTGPHTVYNRVTAGGHVAELHRIYSDADHRLARGLGELERILSTPQQIFQHLEAQGRNFDRQLGRLRRLRNAAIHGGPISDAGCLSLSNFAQSLGYRCLREAVNVRLTGRSFAEHMEIYREDHLIRYDRLRRMGDIRDLFQSRQTNTPPPTTNQTV